MVWKEVLDTLRAEGLQVSDSQVRWALQNRKVSRPALDGSLRFIFTEKHVDELRCLFHDRGNA